ncbi:Tubby- protein 3 [Ancistrocladus abbreviatus]
MKSGIEGMREENGRVSRKGLDFKVGFRWRSWSRRVVQDSSVLRIDGMEQSCWANMPSELLREVLTRIEASESEWPARRNVIACAGVCKNWRDIMKEIVKTPELTGKITFPISVKQPGSRDNLLQCFIRRNRSTQTYNLYLSLTNALAEDGKFLLTARKYRRATCNDFVISLHVDEMSKRCGTYVGKLRSNFLGTKFTIYDAQPLHAGAKMTKGHSARSRGLEQVASRAPVGNYCVAHISYELNVLGSRGPRRMVCVMDSIPTSSVHPGGVVPTQTELPSRSLDSFRSLPFFRSKSNCLEDSAFWPLNGQGDAALTLRNKAPRWHDQLQCWCLNFRGRVTVASVKNFQLVVSPEDGPEHEEIILQFGKVGKDVFTMDYRYPISAFQAFAICLSSFDTRIACE